MYQLDRAWERYISARIKENLNPYPTTKEAVAEAWQVYKRAELEAIGGPHEILPRRA